VKLLIDDGAEEGFEEVAGAQEFEAEWADAVDDVTERGIGGAMLGNGGGGVGLEAEVHCRRGFRP
jgi:hypothetical protein